MNLNLFKKKPMATPLSEREFSNLRKGSEGISTFIYEESGLPLRAFDRSFLVTPSPLKASMALPQQINVGDEISYNPATGPFWRVIRVVYQLGPTAPSRHIWIAPSEI